MAFFLFTGKSRDEFLLPWCIDCFVFILSTLEVKRFHTDKRLHFSFLETSHSAPASASTLMSLCVNITCICAHINPLYTEDIALYRKRILCKHGIDVENYIVVLKYLFTQTIFIVAERFLLKNQFCLVLIFF